MKGFSPKDLVGLISNPLERVVETLERKLGLFSVIIISLASMLGTGLFVIPALAMVEMSGSGSNPVGGIWLAFLLAGIVILPAAISKSELATAMPSSGGAYVYIEKSFGPQIGTVLGVGLWATTMFKSAFALLGFKAYLWVLDEMFGIKINIEIAALILLVLIVIINILGVKQIKKVQTPIVLVSVIFLTIICIKALFTVPMNWDNAFSKDAFGSGIVSVAETSAFVFVAYAGVTKIAAIGGEIKQPEKNIPTGLLLSLLISCIIYVLFSIMMVAAVEPSQYIGENGAREDPVYVFVDSVAGKTYAQISAFLAITMLTGMALAGVMATSRFPFAMARDNLLPKSIENVHPKYDTPHLSIIFTGLAMGFCISFLPVKDIAKLASGFKIMIFIMINCCVIVLRTSSKSHSWYKPKWKSPFFPIIQILGIIVSIWLIYLMGSKALIGALATIIIGLIIYHSYGKKNVNPEITPWDTFKLMFTNPDKAEKRRLYAAFHAADSNSKGHLNLQEFTSAMNSLQLKVELNDKILRNYFHAADLNGDGVLDVDEFLISIQEIKQEEE